MIHECITHHNACDCREAEYQFQIGQRDKEISRLNHQHKNNECATKLLLDALEHSRAHTIKECAALFSGGVRNREIYVNDVEEAILGLLCASMPSSKNIIR